MNFVQRFLRRQTNSTSGATTLPLIEHVPLLHPEHANHRATVYAPLFDRVLFKCECGEVLEVKRSVVTRVSS